VMAGDSQQRREIAVAPPGTKAVLSGNAGLSELLEEGSRKKVMTAAQTAKATATQIGGIKLNTTPAGRGQRNAYQQSVRANSYQFGIDISWQALMNPIVNSGYNTGFGQVANASWGWGSGVNMNQNTGQNYRLPGKRQYIPKTYGIQQKGTCLRFDATGPVAAAAPTAAPKQQ
ncbi:MAG: hypothetical protein EZS28_040423, partial [Streblomastix strix]